MNEEKFLELMTEILDTEEDITMETVLEDLEEWDSLSYVMFQSQMLDLLKKVMNPNEVKNAKTIGDLYELIK